MTSNIRRNFASSRISGEYYTISKAKVARTKRTLGFSQGLTLSEPSRPYLGESCQNKLEKLVKTQPN